MLIPVILLALAFCVHSKEACRCLPGESCWPSDEIWASFNKNLTYPTIINKPLASVCYRGSKDFSTSECGVVQTNFQSTPFRASRPETAQFTVWEQLITNASVHQCVPDPTKKSICYQGRVPFASVNATTVEDVQMAIRFASKYNLKLVVKNSGHETLGRSLGVGSLSIWTHNMNEIVYNSSFVPEGAPPGAKAYLAFTIQAGVSWGQLYEAAAAQNRTVVGGIGAKGTVGAGGGWVLGAGHSILTPYYGLGIDNALQFTVVLPNASHVVANDYTNPHLFWALKGGGGPSFGILTSTTYQSHPAPPITAAFYTSTVNTSSARLQLLSEWIKIHPEISDAGWSGFYPYDNESLALTFIALGDPPTNPAANATLQAFFDKSATIPGVNVTLAVTKAYTGFAQWYNDNFINTTNAIGFNYSVGDFGGVTLASASRLIPRETFENNATALAKAIANVPAARPFLVGGGIMPSINPDSVSSTPAWRTMILDFAIGIFWPETDSAEEIAAIRQNVTDQMDIVRALTPTSGGYLNEADILEVNWQQSYWGDHYPRLQSIKRDIDPEELLIVYKGVNSEAWDDQVICRKY